MSSISLSENHELQVQSYLRFAKLKRDQHVREAVSCINEHREDRLRPGVSRAGATAREGRRRDGPSTNPFCR